MTPCEPHYCKFQPKHQPGMGELSLIWQKPPILHVPCWHGRRQKLESRLTIITFRSPRIWLTIGDRVRSTTRFDIFSYACCMNGYQCERRHPWLLSQPRSSPRSAFLTTSPAATTSVTSPGESMWCVGKSLLMELYTRLAALRFLLRK